MSSSHYHIASAAPPRIVHQCPACGCLRHRCCGCCSRPRSKSTPRRTTFLRLRASNRVEPYLNMPSAERRHAKLLSQTARQGRAQLVRWIRSFRMIWWSVLVRRRSEDALCGGSEGEDKVRPTGEWASPRHGVRQDFRAPHRCTRPAIKRRLETDCS